MAKCVYSAFCNEQHFEYSHQLFVDNDQAPATFDFVTAAGSEFQISWTVDYSINFKDFAQPHNTFYIDYIQLRSKENFSNGDVVNVKILVNDAAYLDAKFDAYSELFAEESPEDLVVEVSKESKIVVEVKVYHQNRSVEKMVEDYEKFWDNIELCDVTFVIEGKEFFAHKQILSARNAIFDSMFETNMKEKKDGRVEIKGIEYDVFVLFLKYIYSGKVDSEDIDVWLKLIVVADRYAMETLIGLCEDYLAAKLTEDNVIDVFVIADLVKNKFLKERCRERMFVNKHEIVRTDGYRSLVESRRADLLSDLHCYILAKLESLQLAEKDSEEKESSVDDS